jgi:hypothetical protein
LTELVEAYKEQYEIREFFEQDLLENSLSSAKCCYFACDGSGHVDQNYQRHYKYFNILFFRKSCKKYLHSKRAKNCPRNPRNKIIIECRRRISELQNDLETLQAAVRDYPEQFAFEKKKAETLVTDLNKKIAGLTSEK